MADAIRAARPGLTVREASPLTVHVPPLTPERASQARARIAEACEALDAEVSHISRSGREQFAMAEKDGALSVDAATRGMHEVEKLASVARQQIVEARQAKEKRLQM